MASQQSRLIATEVFNNQASAGWTTYGTFFPRRLLWLWSPVEFFQPFTRPSSSCRSSLNLDPDRGFEIPGSALDRLNTLLIALTTIFDEFIV
jgi:hypothetical protein